MRSHASFVVTLGLLVAGCGADSDSGRPSFRPLEPGDAVATYTGMTVSGESVTIGIVASDDVEVGSVALEIDGTPVPLDVNNSETKPFSVDNTGVGDLPTAGRIEGVVAQNQPETVPIWCNLFDDRVDFEPIVADEF